MEIIGLLGHQGVGKNYIAEKILPKILDKKPYIVLALADHFKIDCICKHNAKYDKVYGKKDYDTRKLLQKIGTEEGRYIYGKNIWIKITETWIRIFNSRGIKRFIISDIRFQNEVDWIKSLGGIVIKINAYNRYMNRVKQEGNNEKQKIYNIINHPSEKQIDNVINYDFSINNDFNKDVINEIKKKLTIY